MSREQAPHSNIFEVTNRPGTDQPPLPSETRDFAPTPGGWAGIIMATGILAWLIWRQGGDDAGIGWLVASALLGYFIATIAWTAVRRELDRREDRTREH